MEAPGALCFTAASDDPDSEGFGQARGTYGIAANAAGHPQPVRAARVRVAHDPGMRNAGAPVCKGESHPGNMLYRCMYT